MNSILNSNIKRASSFNPPPPPPPPPPPLTPFGTAKGPVARLVFEEDDAVLLVTMQVFQSVRRTGAHPGGVSTVLDDYPQTIFLTVL